MPRQAPYLAVAEALRARIVAGEWQIGRRLPSRARLAEEYGVGRNVVQRSVDLLIADGLLEGRAGSGTYVRVPRERLRMVRARRRERSLAAVTERGRAGAWDAHSEVRVPAPEDIAERLAVSPGDLCVRTHYEFLADGQPVQLSESWEPLALTDGTPIVLPERGPLAGKGVVERMRSIGVDVETLSNCRARPGPTGHRRTCSASASGISCSGSSGPSTTPAGGRWRPPTSSFRTSAGRSSTSSRSSGSSGSR